MARKQMRWLMNSGIPFLRGESRRMMARSLPKVEWRKRCAACLHGIRDSYELGKSLFVSREGARVYICFFHCVVKLFDLKLVQGQMTVSSIYA